MRDPVGTVSTIGVILVACAFLLAGEGHTLLCWAYLALLALAMLSLLAIFPLAILVAWLACLGAAIAISCGVGLRYLFDLVAPLLRLRFLLRGTAHIDRWTRRLLKQCDSWMFGFGYWLESLFLNLVSASALGCLVIFLLAVFGNTFIDRSLLAQHGVFWANAAIGNFVAAFFVPFLATCELLLGRGLQPGLIVWGVALIVFFLLFMCRSYTRDVTDEESSA
jgi:hypothetical protein